MRPGRLYNCSMDKKRFFLVLFFFFMSGFVFSGCNAPGTDRASRAAENTADESESRPQLTILLTELPNAVSLVGPLTEAGATVADALFDGPFDQVNGQEIPVIFSEINVETLPVQVSVGDPVYGASERVESLRPDTSVVPANGAAVCGYSDCVVSFDALPPGAALELDQVQATFRLRDDLRWADGTALTSADAALAYVLFGPELAVSERTAAYEIVDERTVRWRGIPGYVPNRLADVFVAPIPAKDALNRTRDDLLADPAFMSRPSGWGAYRFAADQPESADAIVLERNPYYFGEAPAYDRLVFSARGRGEDQFVYALENGAATVTQSGVDFSGRIEPLLEDVRDRKLSASIYPSLDTVEIAFNYASANETLRDFFANAENRAALTQCVDRPRLIREILYGQSEVPIGAYPSFHALNSRGNGYIGPDPAAARLTLSRNGGAGVSLILTYFEDETNRRTAEFVRDAWRSCGLTVETEGIPLSEIGRIRAGRFDALLTARSGGERLPCRAWLSSPLSGNSTDGGGIHPGGYRSAEADALCVAARFAGGIGADPAMADLAQSFLTSEAISLPLYFEPRFALTTADVCGIRSVIGMRSILWNVERLRPAERGESCYAPQWNDIYR